MYYEIIPGIIITLIFIAGALTQRIKEKKVWNGGVCMESGKEWKLFDVDSSGGRGYTDGTHYCWISFNVDNKKEP